MDEEIATEASRLNEAIGDQKINLHRAGDKGKLDRLAPSLQDYELAAYVDYWQLLLDLKDSDPTTIRAFLGRNENSYVGERMRIDWLRQLGRRQQWELFDSEYPRLAQPDQELACYALQSRQAQGDPRAMDDALPLWLTLLEPPDACYPVLEALIVNKRVLADAVWARIRRQFEANKIAAAMYSMNYLPASQTPDKKLAQTVADAPLPCRATAPMPVPTCSETPPARCCCRPAAWRKARHSAWTSARCCTRRMQAGRRPAVASTRPRSPSPASSSWSTPWPGCGCPGV